MENLSLMKGGIRKRGMWREEGGEARRLKSCELLRKSISSNFLLKERVPDG